MGAWAAPDRVQPFGSGMGFQGHLAEVYIRMRRCPQPIVCLVHGPACGGGFAFVLASDIRIAGESARMNAAFIRIGLTACDMGVSYFLPRLVPHRAPILVTILRHVANRHDCDDCILSVRSHIGV